MRIIELITLGGLFLLAGPASPVAAEEDRLDPSLVHEIEHSIDIGLAYLAGSQLDGGSWSQYPGVSGLALSAMLKAPRRVRQKYAANIQAGLDYLVSNVHDNGGIYPDFEPELRSYNTSICLMALVAADQPEYSDIIVDARDYILSLQADEDEGLTTDSSTYGGIGYNRDERSDISNMQFALEALRASEEYKPSAEFAGKVEYRGNVEQEVAELSNKQLFWEKAILFLQRCQNYKKYNDFEWSKDDGGFVYYPGASKAGGNTSYGSMTYAGMKSFIHAGLSRDDERVLAAFGWIAKNYTVEENPELGNQGLFYYYHTMAKALAVFGRPDLVDSDGTSHNWREDLAGKLISIQAGDGSWVNESGRWWENNPDLVTAYAVMTLEQILTAFEN